MKRLFVILMLLCLCGCSFSASHTSSVSTTVSSDGVEKTTNVETKIENGEISTSSSTITTSEDDPTGLRNKWQELFTYGAEGVSEAGNPVYSIYNSGEENDSSLAAIMIVDGETDELIVYDMGDLEEEDDHLVIHDIEGETSISFALDEAEGGFVIYFQNEDSAFLEYTELDDIIDHTVSIWEVQREDFYARQESED